MRKSTLAVFVLVALAFDSRLQAECSGGGTVAGMKREAALVFEGTVVKIDLLEHETEAAATLHVHRVWKGDVTEDMTVYYILGGPDAPFFTAGRRAVVFAFRMNSKAQQLHYVLPHAPAGAAWTTSCKGPLQLDAARLKQLGRSRKPSPSNGAGLLTGPFPVLLCEPPKPVPLWPRLSRRRRQQLTA